MMSACKEAGCEPPEYKYDGTGLLAVFKFNDTAQKTAQKTTQKVTQKVTQRLTEVQSQILNYLKEHSYATRVELADNIKGSTSDGIKYNLSRLQKIGLLKRMDGKRYGHWEVAEE
jgi:ATP-dependent DNA helicase RecG